MRTKRGLRSEAAGEKAPTQKEAKGHEMKTRAETKAAMMQKAEEQIEALLDWAEESKQPDLSAIEGKVLAVRQALGETMAEEVIQAQASVYPVPGPCCPQCGEAMRYRGQKKKEISSWVGELGLVRGYYYCDPCGRGLFPPR